MDIFWAGISLFGIILSVVFDLFLGYRINQIKIECAPDFLLVIFTVAANVLNLNMDAKGSITENDRFNYFVLSVITLATYIAFYSFGFRKIEEISSALLNILLIFSIFVLWINIRIGSFIINDSESTKQGNLDNGTGNSVS